MTNSYKHTPIIPITRAVSEKQDKRSANRKLRRANKVRTENLEQDMFLTIREVSNVWTFAKDGRQYTDDPAMMRK